MTNEFYSFFERVARTLSPSFTKKELRKALVRERSEWSSPILWRYNGKLSSKLSAWLLASCKKGKLFKAKMGRFGRYSFNLEDMTKRKLFLTVESQLDNGRLVIKLPPDIVTERTVIIIEGIAYKLEQQL